MKKKQNYPLRDIPPELWQKVKVRAVEKKMTIRKAILEGLTLWLDKHRKNK